MKKIRNGIMILCMLMICCTACGTKTDSTMGLYSLDEVFKEYPDTLIEQEQSGEEVTVQLHAAAFEEQRMILDYTVKGKTLEDYYYRYVEGYFNSEANLGCSICHSLYFKQEADSFRVVELYDLDGRKLQQEDIGSMVQIQIDFPATIVNDNEKESVSFEVEISRIFDTKQAEIHQDILYEQGTARVEGLEASPFYTRLIIDFSEDEEFFEELYGYEITDEKGNALAFKGGTDDSLYYSGLPAECSKAGITVIQYKKKEQNEVSYDYMSDRLEVDIR